MKVFNAIGEILKREGTEVMTAYPVNHIIEGAAAAGVRPIIVRQERTGLTWRTPSAGRPPATRSASS
jgi:acetolactate synthase-1/2/3 large subunit